MTNSIDQILIQLALDPEELANVKNRGFLYFAITLMASLTIGMIALNIIQFAA